MVQYKSKASFEASPAGTSTMPKIAIPAKALLYTNALPHPAASPDDLVSFLYASMQYTASRHQFFDVGGCVEPKGGE
jgi:hypothetical protein